MYVVIMSPWILTYHLVAGQQLREELLRGYKNSHMKPTRHCTYLRQRALRRHLFPSQEQIGVLEKCTPQVKMSFVLKVASARALMHRPQGSV